MPTLFKKMLTLVLASFVGAVFADVTSSFGVNFMYNNSGEAVSTSSSFGFAKDGYPAPENWVNTRASASGNTSVTVGENQYKVTWSAGTDGGRYHSGTSKTTDLERLLYGYLDDNVSELSKRVTLTVTGLPAGYKYAVAVILSGDGNDSKTSENNVFSPAYVNGEIYSYSADKELLAGDEARVATTWGDRRASAATALVEGTNVMFIEGIRGETLTISRAVESANISRYTVAGIQIWITNEKMSKIVESTPFEWGFSNVVETAEGKTEYVLAYTNTASPYSFTVPEGVFSLQYLVVAGGGGGGGWHGGGGGAGGVLLADAYAVSAGELFAITVGEGGAGGDGAGEVQGGNGFDSSLNDFVAFGGGGGGGINNDKPEYRHGKSGGSGGGGSGRGNMQGNTAPLANGGEGIFGQGYNGGSRPYASGSNRPGAGGGGARGTAANTIIDGYYRATSGGDGISSSITGELKYYAGGGGGGNMNSTSYSGAEGGVGGGGKGNATSAGASGLPSTGGGGGGGGGQKSGGSGGSGIVVIRYAVSDVSKGFVVSSSGGSYGEPNPQYQGYETMPDVTEYTCTQYEDLGDGVMAYCTGWKLYDSTGKVVNSADELTATLDSSVAGGTLEWQWELRYALTLSSNEDGSVDKTKEGYYGAGTNVTISATPNANCQFDKWVIDGGASVNNANPLTITFADKPISVEAVFMAQGVTVNYGDVESVEGYGETKNYTLNTVGSAYTLTCPKYVVVEENARRKRCIGYTLAFLPDGEETMYEITDAGDSVTATVTYSAPVRLTWKWSDDEYYVSTVATGRGSLKEDKSAWCKTGDVVSGIEIASAENFIGWCAPGTTAEERSGTSLSVTVDKAPITVTAYFTATDKDNLIVNGDFESYLRVKSGLTDDFTLLTAGTWSVLKASEVGKYFKCGLFNSSPTGFNFAQYNGEYSASVGSDGDSSDSGSIGCEVNIPFAGIYEFSCYWRPPYYTAQIGANTWTNKIELVSVSGKSITIGESYMRGGNSNTKYVEFKSEFNVSRAGTYTLKFSIPPESIIQSANKPYAHFGVDNVSLKLKKKTGAFTVIIR